MSLATESGEIQLDDFRVIKENECIRNQVYNWF